MITVRFARQNIDARVQGKFFKTDNQTNKPRKNLHSLQFVTDPDRVRYRVRDLFQGHRL